jgi:hypothetical protein
MGFTVTIEPGDTLVSIAAEHGFLDAEAVWQAPENAQLRADRKPDLLAPGDQLFVPDRQPRTVQVQTGQRKTAVVDRTPVKLRLILRDAVGEPRADQACTIEVDGVSHAATTDGAGLVEVDIPPTARDAVLRIGGEEHALAIGYLGPATTQAGAVARLRNLGYLVVDDDDAATRLAVELFQADHQLTIDGTWQSITGKLEESHGG